MEDLFAIKGKLRLKIGHETNKIHLVSFLLARASRFGEKRRGRRREEEEGGEGEKEDQKGMFLSWNHVYFGFLRFWYGD